LFAKNLSSHYLDAIQAARFGAALKIPSQKQTIPTFTILVLSTSFYQTAFESKNGAFRNNLFTSMASMTLGYALPSDTSTIFPLEALLRMPFQKPSHNSSNIKRLSLAWLCSLCCKLLIRSQKPVAIAIWQNCQSK
jgi:hypothetical protein